MASTEQLKNAERIIQLTEDREKVSQKIKDIIKEMNSATKEEKENLEKRLRTQKVILDTAKKENPTDSSDMVGDSIGGLFIQKSLKKCYQRCKF